MGDVIQFTIPLSALIISWQKDDKEGMKELLYSTIFSMAATWGMKVAFNKKRPKGGRYSFPSGHTSLASSGSSYLGFRYGNKYGLPFFMGTAFVGYSRIAAHRHYWTDIFVGGLVGGVSAYLFTHKYSAPKPEPIKFQPNRIKDKNLKLKKANVKSYKTTNKRKRKLYQI